MKQMILMLTVTVLTTILSQPAYACFCSKGQLVDADRKPVKVEPELLRKWWLTNFKGAVFIGTVSNIENVKVHWFNRRMRKKKVTVEVERAWFGVSESSFVIYTSPGEGGDCGVPYVKGQRYFFFADLIGGLVDTNSCFPWTLSPEGAIWELTMNSGDRITARR